jgi:hypothetical protein
MALSVSPSWDVLADDDGGMTGMKLLGRMENVAWEPPKFIFRIERHGATVMGSSRAELQEWTIDLEQRTKTVQTVGRRQVRPMQGRLDAKPIAEEVAAAILTGWGFTVRPRSWRGCCGNTSGCRPSALNGRGIYEPLGKFGRLLSSGRSRTMSSVSKPARLLYKLPISW